MTPTETSVARAVSTVLQRPRISLQDDMIALGADSFSFICILLELETDLGLAIEAGDADPTLSLAQFAAWIDQGMPAKVD